MEEQKTNKIHDRLQKQMNFILEIDRMKEISRQNYLADASRKENDAEHSWHLAVMCLILSEYANAEIDITKTVSMLLIHDLIEIYAGDTYAYDEAGNATKAAREAEAAKRLYSMLPEDQGSYFQKLWLEFDEGETEEALFANALDKIQPLMLNAASKGRSWKEHGVRGENVLRRNERTHLGSEALWEFAKQIIDENMENGNLQ